MNNACKRLQTIWACSLNVANATSAPLLQA